MNNNEDHKDKLNQDLLKAFTRILNLLILLLVLVFGLVIWIFATHPLPQLNFSFFESEKEETQTSQVVVNSNSSGSSAESKPVVNYWRPPDENELNNNAEKDLILYGKDIIVHTSDYFGPNGKIFKNNTNGMNCQNCHLEAGTKVFGNNYSAVASTYPKYRARSGTIENMYKRINDCFERSLNGKPLDTNSKEMQAIVAYMKWLGKDVKKGEKPEGSGLKKVEFLDRAADPEKGKLAYTAKCASCHQADGQGIMNADKTGYTYPPLWGPNSYNDGAGLFRLSNFASFVMYNMPLGVNHESVQLTKEEAWDIAAFVNSMPRPHKDTRKDWPKVQEKPFDHPFGPYADGFSEKQHKYGPFQPIVEKSKSLTKK